MLSSARIASALLRQQRRQTIQRLATHAQLHSSCGCRDHQPNANGKGRQIDVTHDQILFSSVGPAASGPSGGSQPSKVASSSRVKLVSESRPTTTASAIVQQSTGAASLPSLTAARIRSKDLCSRYDTLRDIIVKEGLTSLRYRESVRLAQALLDSLRGIKAFKKFGDAKRAGLCHQREKIGNFVLSILNDIETNFQDSETKTERALHDDRDPFIEHVLRIEATAYAGAEGEAITLLESFAEQFETDLNDINVNRPAKEDGPPSRRRHRRRIDSMFAMIRGLLDSTYQRDSSTQDASLLEETRQRRRDTLLRVVRIQAIFRLYPLASVLDRKHLHQYFSVIDSSVQFVREIIASLQSTDATSARESIHVVLAYLTSSHRLVEAYRLYEWADQAGVVISEKLAAQFLRNLLHDSQDSLADEVIRIVQHQARRRSSRVLLRKTYQLIAQRHANNGLEDAVQKALDAIERHYNTPQHARRNKTYAYHTRLLLASRTGNVDQCLYLLRRTYSVDALLADSEEAVDPDQSAANLYRDVKKPAMTGRTLRILVETYLNADWINEAESVIERATAQGFEVPLSAFDALLTKYAQRNDIASASVLFDEMRQSQGGRVSSAALNAMIGLFAQNQDVESATDMLRHADRYGVQPHHKLYTSLLHAHLRARSWEGATRLFAMMLQSPDVNLQPSIADYNVMLQVHLERPLPVQQVFEFLEQMLAANVVPSARTFAIVLGAATKAGMTGLAEEVFDIIERKLGGKEGRPEGQGANAYHFTIMIQHYLEMEKYEIASEYLQELIDRKEPVGGVLRSIIVQAYSRTHGDSTGVDVAQKLAESYVAESPQDFLTIYRSLISRAARGSEVEVVESLIRDTLSRAIDVPLPVWTDLLDALRRRGNSEGAMQVWHMIFDRVVQEETKLSKALGKTTVGEPTEIGAAAPAVARSRRHVLCVPLSVIIDVLTFSARYDDVAKVWLSCRQAGFGFDSHNWNHLAVALMQARRIPEACDIIERVLNADPPSQLSIRLAAHKAARDDHEVGSGPSLGLPPFIGQAEQLFGDDVGDRAQGKAAGRKTQIVYPPDDPGTRLPQSLRHEDAQRRERQPVVRPDRHDEDEVDEEPAAEDDGESDETDVSKMLGPLEARQLLEPVFSPWFAHFETMRTLNEIILAAEQRGGHIFLRRQAPADRAKDDDDEDDLRFYSRPAASSDSGPQGRSGGAHSAHNSITVAELMDTHPRVRELLALYERYAETVQAKDEVRAKRQATPRADREPRQEKASDTDTRWNRFADIPDDGEDATEAEAEEGTEAGTELETEAKL